MLRENQHPTRHVFAACTLDQTHTRTHQAWSRRALQRCEHRPDGVLESVREEVDGACSRRSGTAVEALAGRCWVMSRVHSSQRCSAKEVRLGGDFQSFCMFLAFFQPFQSRFVVSSKRLTGNIRTTTNHSSTWYPDRYGGIDQRRLRIMTVCRETGTVHCRTYGGRVPN